MLLTDNEIEKEQELQCYHCGNPCSDKIHSEDKHFCCTGCKTVYKILSSNELDDYYSYEENPGTSMLNKESAKYNFLENEEIARSLLDYQSDDIHKISFHIPSIHCSSCIWLLENLHRLHPAVKNSRVNFIRKDATITFEPKNISLKELANLLDSVGYGPLINWDSTEKRKSKRVFGPLQLKLGVAGFCFGNIMLLSFPEYFGFEISDDGFRNFFSILNLLLAIPVLLYSSTDYLLSAYRSVQQRFINIDVPIALGIITLFVRSSYEVISATGPGFFDSFTGFIFFLLIGKWFQDRTYQHLSFERDFKSYFPLAVSRVEGDSIHPVPVKDLRNGDIVKIRNNEIIPTDCLLLSDSTDIDYSFVTGEQRPVRLLKGATIFAGGRQKGTDIDLEVSKPVSQSYLTSLWNQSGDREEIKTQKIIDKVAQYFTIVVLVIAIGTAIFWSLVDSSKVWESVTAVLIVACPCALALSIPFTYGNILRVTGRNKFYMKSAEVVEKFRNIDTILFDKTGTLTWSDKGEVKYCGEELSMEDWSVIKSLTSASIHPLSKKIYKSIDTKIPGISVKSFAELAGQGLKGIYGETEFRLGNVEYCGRPKGIKTSNSVVVFSRENKAIGWFELETKFREGLETVVNDLSSKYHLGLISGDNDADKNSLEKIFPAETQMNFELKPDQKRSLVQKIIYGDRSVLMMGDGLNDAAALSSATVGVAITDDVSAFSPACDVIYDGKAFNQFHTLLSFIKGAKYIVVGSFVLSFLYNFIGLAFAVSGSLTPIFAAILMPLSSITVLLYTTISVRVSAKLKGLQ